MSSARHRVVFSLAFSGMALWGMSQERMYEAMQRPTTIVAIDPPPEVLVYTPEHAPDSLSMLLRAGTIELRDPLPHELVPGPKRAQIEMPLAEPDPVPMNDVRMPVAPSAPQE
jgi:hypothetical protein